MRKIMYKNANNISIDNTYFKLNRSYYLYVFFKKDINSYFRLKIADKLAVEL